MTTHPTEEQIDGFVEGVLAPAQHAEVLRHMEECAQCRAEAGGTRALLESAAALPRRIEPPRDLWPGIQRLLAGSRSRRGSGAYWTLAVAASVLAVIAFAVLDLVPGVSRGWQVVTLSGTPTIGTAVVTGRGAALRVGDWLETDAVSTARVSVGRIGQVDVQPRTRLRLVDARPSEHRLALARGGIAARVDAPPRLFIVETPAGTAVDLGCAYELMVDSLGRGSLRVTSGWVEFSWRARRSIVPLGFVVETRPGIGPGTPVAEDAPPALPEALVSFDFQLGGARAARAALAAARSEDAVSVWHLLSRVERGLRPEVYGRLAALVPPPDGVTRDAVIRLDSTAVNAYWNAIKRIAWRREVLRGVREIDARTGLAVPSNSVP
jgi:hypothetical protein